MYEIPREHDTRLLYNAGKLFHMYVTAFRISLQLRVFNETGYAGKTHLILLMYQMVMLIITWPLHPVYRTYCAETDCFIRTSSQCLSTVVKTNCSKIPNIYPTRLLHDQAAELVKMWATIS